MPEFDAQSGPYVQRAAQERRSLRDFGRSLLLRVGGFGMNLNLATQGDGDWGEIVRLDYE